MRVQSVIMVMTVFLLSTSAFADTAMIESVDCEAQSQRLICRVTHQLEQDFEAYRETPMSDLIGLGHRAGPLFLGVRLDAADGNLHDALEGAAGYRAARPQDVSTGGDLLPHSALASSQRSNGQPRAILSCSRRPPIWKRRTLSTPNWQATGHPSSSPGHMPLRAKNT